MRGFTVEDGLVAPLDRANADTDFIIPKQFLKSIRRTGFGVNLFDAHRYLDRGEPGMDHGARPLNPDFVLNRPRYRGATILLARDNFGCGSSREHAVWALADYGFRAVLAPSFADIFRSNCFKNGLLPVELERAAVDALFEEVAGAPGYRLTIDLPGGTVTRPDGGVLPFGVDPFRKRCLIEGLDDIDITLADADAIREFEEGRRRAAPWCFEGLGSATGAGG